MKRSLKSVFSLALVLAVLGAATIPVRAQPAPAAKAQDQKPLVFARAGPW